MKDKGLLGDILDGGNITKESGVSDIDPALGSEYSPGDKPATTAPPGDGELSLDAILVDIRKKAAMHGSAEEDAPLSGTMPEDGLLLPTDDSSAPPGAEPVREKADDRPLDDRQVIMEMTEAIRELSAEVKQLRVELGERPPEPRRKPQGSNEEAEENTETAQSESEKKKPNRALSIISNILFYAVIVAMVLGAFLMRSTSKGEPFMLAGFSAANVLTSSMEDVYPRGSLIITKQVDAKDLVVGDDITFMVSEDTSITHRIIGIAENYQGTGQRAFETKGTRNPNPDKDMVAAANVVGKVVFSSKALGDSANFVRENWPILIFGLIVIIALISFLKWNAKKINDEEAGDDKKTEDGSKTKKEKSSSRAKK